MKEKEINLIDLIVEVLLKWRIIVVWMLVGGILMGCFSYISSHQAAKTQDTHPASSDELEYPQSSLTDQQISNVNIAITYDHLLEITNAYFQESVKMQIDPLNTPQAQLTFQVVAEDTETAQRIAQVYKDMIPDGLSQWLSAKTPNGTSEAAMSELISLNRDFKKLPIGSTGTTNYNIIEEMCDTFSVAICHISEEQCIELAEKVDEYFQEQQSQLSQKMGTHHIQLVSQNFSYVMDTMLLEKLQAIHCNIAVWSSSAATIKSSFSEKEWLLYNKMTANEQANSPEMPSEKGEEQDSLTTATIKPSVNTKYILIGMILFAFIYVLYVFLKYIFSARIRATDDIAAIYGVSELGVIPAESGKKKMFALIDNLILKLRFWNKRTFTMEEAIGLTAVSVKMAALKGNLNEICCIGCNLKENAVKTAEAIQSTLKDVNISVKVLNNVLYDQGTMEQLSSAKGAFLLERVGETLYDEITKELELLHRLEIEIIGIIIVE